MKRTWTAGEILKFSNVHWEPLALQAAIQLGLFTALDELTQPNESASIATVAEKLGCNPRALEMLCSALIALGFLSQTGQGLSLPESSRRYLSSQSKDYLGFIISHHAHLLKAWGGLAGSVMSGQAQPVETGDFRNEEEREAFLMGMFNIGTHQAETIAAALSLENRGRLLDVGGGPGTYAIYFCLANPHLRATIFDRPSTKPFATKVVEQHKLTDRIDFVSGDFIKDSLPTGYDVAWLSQVLHGETPENAAALIKNAAATLNPQGLLVVQEFVLEDDRTGPPHSALFGLNMLVCTDGGQAYTWSEISRMMTDAGATSIKRLEVTLPEGCGIIVGTMG